MPKTYTGGPVNLHKGLATGESLKEATSKATKAPKKGKSNNK